MLLKDVLDCLRGVSGLPAETPPSAGSAVTAQLSCMYQWGLSGSQNTWIALLELPFWVELSCHFWAFARAVLLLLGSCSCSLIPRGSCRPYVPCVDGHFSLQEYMGSVMEWVHSCWCWQLEGWLQRSQLIAWLGFSTLWVMLSCEEFAPC